jgi:hypothetical protein
MSIINEDNFAIRLFFAAERRSRLRVTEQVFMRGFAPGKVLNGKRNIHATFIP